MSPAGVVVDSVLDTMYRLMSGVIVRADSGCWEWQKSQDRHGYGRIWYQGRVHRTHRVMYAAVVGEIPDGMTIDHLCYNRSCCNPAHLELVTFEENLRRRR